MEPKQWLMNKEKYMKEARLSQLIQEAFRQERQMLHGLSEDEIYDYMISKLNFCQRKQYHSSRQLSISIRVGDICFIDFGQAYINEAGYLHFGLILSIVHAKALVVPMTGNPHTYQKRSRHTKALPKIKGLNKSSVLFLNDAKWINTARILDVKAHLDVQDPLFAQIRKEVKKLV